MTNAEPATGAPPRDGRSATSSFQVLAAEALVVPTGILAAALITRTLGASGYGLFTLALAIVLAAENVLGSFFGRATIKLVSEASDPRPVAAAASRLYIALGLAAMLVLWIAAEPLARLFDAPRFALLLQIAALDLPATALSRSLRDTLVGLGRFGQRARAAAVRWSSRLLLIALAVSSGLGVEGALAACVGASLLEALASRTGLGLLTAPTAGFPLSRLLAYSVPLLIHGVGISIFARLDLFALKALGFDAATAGLYAAAGNAAGSFLFAAIVLSPLLLSTLSRRLADGRRREARALVRDAVRFALLAIPFAAILAGAAPELLRLVYGAGFESAAPVMRLLMVAAAAHVVAGISIAAVVAAGHAWRIAAIGALAPLVALAGHLLAIPAFGPIGAAAVSTSVAVVAAAAAVALLASAWHVLPPATTAIRAVLVAGPLFAVALWWRPGTFGTLVEVAVLGSAAILLLVVVGEFDGIELHRVATGIRRLLGRPPHSPQAWDRVPETLDRRGHYLDRFLGRLKRREILALVARWRGAGAGWVLKTDLFEEAMGPDTLLGALGGGGRRPIGIDVSAAIVVRARQRDRAGHGRFVVADVRHLPFRPGSLHTAVSPSSLDHFTDPHDLHLSLEELRRALAPSGRLVVTLDNRSNVTDSLLHVVAAAGLVGYYIGRSYTARELREELRQAGFRVLDQAGLLHNPRLAASGAVALARRLDRPRVSRWVRRRLLASRRLESTRWRHVTASFVAALAVPDEAAEPPGGGQRRRSPARATIAAPSPQRRSLGMLTTRSGDAADRKPAYARGARRGAADHWGRAREVLRDEGLRSLFWKLLGETIYRRAWVVERRLVPAAVTRAGVAPTPPGLEIRELTEGDVAAYLGLRPQDDAGTLRRRLSGGERCFVGCREGRIEHATWVTLDVARIGYLGRDLPLASGDAYAGEAFTRPSARGAALSVAVADAMAAQLGREGFRRLLGVVMPENRAGVAASWRWGYRPIGVMRTLQLGPWRLFLGGFARSPRQAQRLASTVWRDAAPAAAEAGDS